MLHTPLSINSLDSHLHLNSFQRCLLLQAFGSSLYLNLQVLCHSLCIFSLVLDIRLKTLIFKFFSNIRNTQFGIGIIDIVTTTTTFTGFNTIKKKYRIIPNNINNFWPYFTFLIVHGTLLTQKTSSDQFWVYPLAKMFLYFRS